MTTKSNIEYPVLIKFTMFPFIFKNHMFPNFTINDQDEIETNNAI